jgi:anaerobic ribonucleoside-triphosphate reductase
MAEEQEKLVKTSVYLEEEVIEALEEAAKELEKETGRRWSKGAVIRVALSDFFTRRGRML